MKFDLRLALLLVLGVTDEMTDEQLVAEVQRLRLAEAPAAEPGEPIRYTLKRPIDIAYNAGKDNERIEQLTELTMRTDIDAADMMATDGVEGENAQMIAMIAQLTGQPVAVIRRLKAVDYGFFVERLAKL